MHLMLTGSDDTGINLGLGLKWLKRISIATIWRGSSIQKISSTTLSLGTAMLWCQIIKKKGCTHL